MGGSRTMPKLIKGWDNCTITVGELIQKLSEYPPDMAIAYTWESQVTPVVLDEIKVIQESDYIYGPVVLMNAET
jgi:hypothetical protein